MAYENANNLMKTRNKTLEIKPWGVYICISRASPNENARKSGAKVAKIMESGAAHYNLLTKKQR